MMRLLAFDISTTNIGWAIYDDGRHVKSGCFSPQGNDAYARMPRIAEWASAIALHHWDVVAYEEPRGNHRNMHTNIVLGYAVGCVLHPFLINGVETMPIHIMKIKATRVHKKARRAAAAEAQKQAVGPDEADAIGCALAAWSEIRERQLRSQ